MKPPEEFWLELLSRLPEWFYSVLAIAILASLAVTAYWFNLGAKRLTEQLGRENRLLGIKEELEHEREQHRLNQAVANQLVTALNNIRSLLGDLNELRRLSDKTPNRGMIYDELTNLLRRAVDMLASDVKFKPGELHRCGFWTELDGQLTLVAASAGFPSHYLFKRQLAVDASLAGKAFRRQQVIRRDDVRKDDDWVPNPDSASNYRSVICIPIRNLGVLTIDGFEPMATETELIGQLYATVIDALLTDYFRIDTENSAAP